MPSFYRRRGLYLQNILFGFIFMPDAKRNAAIYYIEDGFDPKKGLNGRRSVESYSGGEFYEPNFLDTNDVSL